MRRRRGRENMKTWTTKGFLAIGMVTVCVLVLGLGFWATQARLAGAVIAPGMVEVEGHIQVVEHPDGGVVEDVLVREGDLISAGTVLMRLDGSVLEAQLSIIQTQLDEIEARSARLVAEREGSKMPVISGDFAARAKADPDISEIYDGQMRLYHARADTYQKTTDALSEQRNQIRSEISGQDAQESAFGEQLAIVIDELEGLDRLLKQGLVVKSQVLELRRERAQLSGLFGEVQASIARNRGRIAELDTELLRLAAARREEAETELRELLIRRAELTERKGALSVKRDRLELKSPITGIVHSLAVTSVNAVIRPDESVLYVVPQDVRLVVAARVDATQVDSIYAGQDVVLRFSAFQSRTTPELKGTLDRVSPDVLTDDATRRQYYSAYVSLKGGELELLEERRLVPGMPVEIFIQTSTRTPLAYLLQPFTDYFNRALRED